MIHPNTRLQFINDTIGYGVFATADIPEGTIVYVKDGLELVVTPEAYAKHEAPMREVVDKYSYIDEHGDRIVSWDFAKYVNHCCNCNTISTGYGFEMAIRPIKAGEQITDEYGIFNLDEEMELTCNQPGCRKRIGPGDFDKHYPEWDSKIKDSIGHLFTVDQPLLKYLTATTQRELGELKRDPGAYKSVYALKYHRKRVPTGSDNHVGERVVR
ncbi:SET domain-containing protein [Lewinella sp. IMCC34183]|uniref:SET domain-containing protein n=1 Tax=Lewinella sp. IMCC34183 TaxID=2248762 RepID=UPI000E24EFD0|nr:SET domain-containing protein [Lewinella sp. IMCC34183]